MTSVSSTATTFSYENFASRSSIKKPHPPKSSGTNPNTDTVALSTNKSDEKIITTLADSEKSDSETILTATANTVFLNGPIIDGDPKRKRTADLGFSNTSDILAKKRKIKEVQKPEISAEQFDNVVLVKPAKVKSPTIDVYGRTPEQIVPLQLASDYMNKYSSEIEKYVKNGKFLNELLKKYQADSKYEKMSKKEAAERLFTLQVLDYTDNIIEMVEKDLLREIPNLSKSDLEQIMDSLTIWICRDLENLAVEKDLIKKVLTIFQADE